MLFLVQALLFPTTSDDVALLKNAGHCVPLSEIFITLGSQRSRNHTSKFATVNESSAVGRADRIFGRGQQYGGYGKDSSLTVTFRLRVNKQISLTNDYSLFLSKAVFVKLSVPKGLYFFEKVP